MTDHPDEFIVIWSNNDPRVVPNLDRYLFGRDQKDIGPTFTYRAAAERWLAEKATQSAAQGVTTKAEFCEWLRHIFYPSKPKAQERPTKTNYPCHYRTDFIELHTRKLVALADTIVPVHNEMMIHINAKLYRVVGVAMDIDYPHGDHANFIQRVVLE